MLMKQASDMIAIYKAVAKELRSMMKNTYSTIGDLIAQKNRIADQVRSLQGISAALCVAPGWQSPSFLSSQQSQAGLETGSIKGTINDYKRDHHADALRYEKQFAKAYIDATLRFPPQAFLTSSGMAALTTIIAALLDDKTCTGPVLLGRSSYFENIELVQTHFPGRIIFIDELDTEAILVAIKDHAPSAIFLDTLCNAPTIAIPNVDELFPKIAAIISRPTTIVLDATGTSIFTQPLKGLPRFSASLRIVVFESMLKYHQFGMDRVSGGIMWRTGMSPLHLFNHRMHCGTNIADASAVSLPQPNRKLLHDRLLRHHRNATMIAKALDDRLRMSKKKIALESVVYPGLPSHPAYSWVQHQPFHGSFVILKLKEKYRTTERYKKFLQCAIDEARKQRVNLVGGSSFGLSTTRVYLTALHAIGTTEPFLRISAGTETVGEIEKIILAITRALEALP